MNNDLISREALQKAFEKALFSNIDDLMTMGDLINNAPAVEPTFEVFKAICCEDCSKRPQGKWIFEKADNEHIDGYICSMCRRSFHTKVPYFSEYNYCPNCGADMRKGGAE